MYTRTTIGGPIHQHTHPTQTNNPHSDGATALHIAAMGGKVDACRALLSAGVDAQVFTVDLYLYTCVYVYLHIYVYLHAWGEQRCMCA